MNPDLFGASGRAEAGPGKGMDPTADLLASADPRADLELYI